MTVGLHPMAKRISINGFRGLTNIKFLSINSGFMIAIQSRINGELSDQMGDSLEAALVSFGTGLIFVSLISLFR